MVKVKDIYVNKKVINGLKIDRHTVFVLKSPFIIEQKDADIYRQAVKNVITEMTGTEPNLLWLPYNITIEQIPDEHLLRLQSEVNSIIKIRSSIN